MTIIPGLEALATPVDELTTFPGNPRRGDIEAIARSLATFGQRKPIVVDAGGTVIAGNHTLLAARQLGWERIAVVRVDDDPTTAKAYNLADNRTAELGTYDDAALAALMAELHDADAELFAATGWGDGDLSDLLDRITDPVPPPEADELPTDVPAATEPGDVWVLGDHRLECGDCTDPVVVETVMAGEQADILITDPPYGVSYSAKNSDLNRLDGANRNVSAIEGDDLTPGQVRVIWDGAWQAARRHMRPGACYYVTGPQGGDLLLLLLQSLAGGGFPLRHMLIWAKNRIVFGRSDYHYQHEPIIHGWVEGAHHFYGPANETSVWQIDKPQASELHPTMKPVALYTRALTNSTRRGDIVLDPFAGSGTAAIAAEMTGRRARLVEIDPHYCDVICRRWQELTGGEPVRG